MHFQNQRSEGRGQKSEVRGQHPEGRSQKSEVGSQRAVVLSQTAAFCFLLSALFLAGGCSKTPASDLRSPTSAPPSPTPLAPDTVLRIHWAGKQTLGVAASSYSFMRLWNLPEGRQLETQLLQKFSAAPWRVAANQPAAANNASAALRPMLYDVVNEECCLEIRGSAAQPEQTAFAIRLDDTRAKDWRKGLADVLGSTEGGYPTTRAHGWSLKSPRSQAVYEWQRAGGWVVFGRAQGTNALFQEVVDRIEREQVPFTVTTASHWLSVDADLSWLLSKANAAGFTGQPPTRPSATLSPSDGERDGVRGISGRLSMVISGDGANTVTTGELVFAKPLALNLEPWNFPKSQVQGPVVGFSAVRGVGSWLTASKMWSDLKLGRAPNQIFTWADASTPLQMHLAAPGDSAKEIAKSLGDTFLTSGNAWLTEHGLGSIAPLPDAGGVIWKDLPMIAPFVGAKSDDLLVGGLVPNPQPQPGAPAPVQIYPRPSLDEMLAEISSRTNLVAYEFETTGNRAESVHVLGQILRAITRHPQIPAGTPSAQWLQAARPRLGNCTTTVTLAAPDRLAFERKSTTGFAALELHLIADWMESPEFPRGFYSTLSPVGPALKPAGK